MDEVLHREILRVGDNTLESKGGLVSPLIGRRAFSALSPAKI